MIDIKELNKEDELVILEEGLKSRFWEVFTARYQHMIFTTMGAALSERTESREWTAGKATGMKDALAYPATRVRNLRTMTKDKKEE